MFWKSGQKRYNLNISKQTFLYLVTAVWQVPLVFIIQQKKLCFSKKTIYYNRLRQECFTLNFKCCKIIINSVNLAPFNFMSLFLSFFFRYIFWTWPFHLNIFLFLFYIFCLYKLNTYSNIFGNSCWIEVFAPTAKGTQQDSVNYCMFSIIK